MAGSVSGDFAKLLKFAKKVGNLAGQNAMTAVSSTLADTDLELIDEGFQEERDPMGRPWESKVFPDGRPILQGSRKRLRKGFKKVQVSSRGFEIRNDEPHFIFNQRGTGIFGPKGKRIKPKKAGGVLAWKGPSGAMFRRSVDGSPARKMLPEKGFIPARWQARRVKRVLTVMRERFARG